ncbi:hypothetical protein SUGI_0069810 [Cryptomeria japonica]|nr:hypothetical protein SUGI_0069810 [Cryptomeria japonica]
MSEQRQELKAKFGSKMGFITGVNDVNHIDLQSSEEGGMELLGASNLKLLENAREEGWIEVKRKRDKRAKDDSIRLIFHSHEMEEVNQHCTQCPVNGLVVTMGRWLPGCSPT